MINVVAAAYEAYRSVDPQDMRDTEFFCSTETRRSLVEAMPVSVPDENPFTSDQLFGRPLRIDDAVPFGTVKAVTETEFDRSMRRMAAEWRVVNVMKPVAFDWSVSAPPPTPTLRALVRHWRKKFKSFARSSDS